MKVELIKVNGKTIGWSLVAESFQDSLTLGSVRNLEFMGYGDSAMTYYGVLHTRPNSYVALKLSWTQKAYERAEKIVPIPDSYNSPAGPDEEYPYTSTTLPPVDPEAWDAQHG